MSHVISSLAYYLSLRLRPCIWAPLSLTWIPSSKTPLVRVLWWSTPQVHRFPCVAWVRVLVEVISTMLQLCGLHCCVKGFTIICRLRQKFMFSEIYILYIFLIYMYTRAFILHLSSPLLYITDAPRLLTSMSVYLYCLGLLGFISGLLFFNKFGKILFIWMLLLPYSIISWTLFRL